MEEDDARSKLRDSLQALRFRRLRVTDDSYSIGLVTMTDLLGIASSRLLPRHRSQAHALQERLRGLDIMMSDIVNCPAGHLAPARGTAAIEASAWVACRSFTRKTHCSSSLANMPPYLPKNGGSNATLFRAPVSQRSLDERLGHHLGNVGTSTSANVLSRPGAMDCLMTVSSGRMTGLRQRNIRVYSPSMSATTVKLDSALLEELRQMKPAHQTLTALVRELLEAEIRRRRMARAATEYTAFVEQNPDEAAELELWASSPLEREAMRRRKKRR